MKQLHRSDGYSLIEVLSSLALLGVFVAIVLAYLKMRTANANDYNSLSTRERLTANFQEMIRLPASLRNSARAAKAGGATALNPELGNCIFGFQAGQCQNDAVKPFSLFIPVVKMAADGSITAIQQISAPEGGAQVVHIDSFGGICSTPGPDCFFVVETKFRAQCGPATLPAIAPADLLAANAFQPTATCTIADLIEVYFQLKPDPEVTKNFPMLASKYPPIAGSTILAVKTISGNDAQ